MAAAAAVLRGRRLKHDRRAERTPISCSCWAIRNRCWALAITVSGSKQIGVADAQRGLLEQRALRTQRQELLGMPSRESGHSREPGAAGQAEPDEFFGCHAVSSATQDETASVDAIASARETPPTVAMRMRLAIHSPD